MCAPRPERGAKLEALLRPVAERASSGLEPGLLRGWTEWIAKPWKIDGWAHDQAHPDLPVLLEVLLDGRLLGTTLACRYRKDLLDAGLGRGRCRFVFASPVKLDPAAIEALVIRRSVDGAEIPLSAKLKALLGERPTGRQAPRLRLTT